MSGKITLKHVYEIAKIKQHDEGIDGRTLMEICKSIIGTAHSLGIKVERSLDPVEYGEFLENRKKEIEKQEEELEQARQAKLLRL